MAVIPEDILVTEEAFMTFVRFGLIAPILTNYLFFTMMVLIVYDYILTFTSEVMYIWKTSPKLSAPTLFFVLNRYGGVLLWLAASLFPAVRSNDVSVCHNLVFVIRIGKIAYYMGFIGIFILRTWAVYGKSMVILAITGIFGAARMALAVYIDWTLIYPKLAPEKHSKLGMCKTIYKSSYASWNIALYCMQLSFDTIVFLLTIAQTVLAAREHKRRKLRNSLSVLLARDASLYFLPLITLLIIGLCASVIPSANILANHLVLNLRALSRKRACGACTFAQIMTPLSPRGSAVHPDGNEGFRPNVPDCHNNRRYIKSKIEEHIEEEPATFFFDPAFGRRSLMLDISHGSSEYGTESDSGESGMMFAPMNDEEEGSELEMEEMGTDS